MVRNAVTADAENAVMIPDEMQYIYSLSRDKASKFMSEEKKYDACRGKVSAYIE